MLRTIHLYGDLAEKYGKTHKLAVNSVGEALRALDANYPGFRRDIHRDEKYFVCAGDQLIEENTLDNDSVFLTFNDNNDFHICPEIAGAGGSGGSIFTMVLGAILMVASIWVPPAGLLGIKMLSAGLVFSLGLSL